VDDALAHLGCSAEVLTLDPMHLDEILDNIRRTGRSTGTSDRADAIVAELRRRLDELTARVAGAASRTTLVLEWTDPAFCAGHWVPDLVTAAGGEPVLSRPGGKSVGVAWEDVAACEAEVVLVAPCGYRLDGAAELAQRVVDAGRLPDGAQVWALDADAHIVRPGPRVVEGAEIIAQVLHPDRCGIPDPAHARRIR